MGCNERPLSDVVILGNLVHAIGPRRYRYAAIIAGCDNAPRGLQFSGNHVTPGTDGGANREIE